MKDAAELHPLEVKELASSDEFAPRAYKARVFNLRAFGVPQVPVIGRTDYRQVDEASPWHVHSSCIEFVYCTAGACVYESEGRRFGLTPGMMFVSRQHEAHRQLECPKGYATFYMLFRPSASGDVRWFADRFARLPRLFPCSRSVAVRFVKTIAMAERGDSSLGTRIRMQTLVRSLWLDVIDSATLSIKRKVPEVFGAIAGRMQEHPEREYPLDRLVAESGVSKASFISLFKTSHGLTPHAFLLHCRVEESKRLLEEGASVKAVADRFGFPTPQHFSRTFRNFVGITPRKWLAGRKA
ncbi:MAG: helix-turn-helix transcriptional regulator [Kiritimatiellae bacterium]|nr:helix-turn-helix transcriptional regulator [Kiritimatiellia bacterium]